MKKILIMGLPGAGKTYFANKLQQYLQKPTSIADMPASVVQNKEFMPVHWYPTVRWFNADEIRKKFNDWDFSREGRIRQSLRMAAFALTAEADFVVCDFVAPLVEMRSNFDADWTIWMDTIDSGRYEDTNKEFSAPTKYDFRITEQNADHWVPIVAAHIVANRRRPVFDWKKETVQLLGRYQPWHAGHRALFDQAIQKTGQVIIQIRDCEGWQNSNPFALEQVKNRIRRDLDPVYQGKYEIQTVPNIVEIAYGRDVGYKITQIELSDEIKAISATKIRQELKERGELK